MQENIRGIINLNPYPLSIKWRLTNCCNYRCSYCVRNNKVESLVNYKKDEQVALETISEISKIIHNKQQDTKIELIGGEVSLFNLHRIIDSLYQENKNYLKRINFTSNFSQGVDYYNDLIVLCDKLGISLSMTFSFHPEYISLKTFINKFNRLIKLDNNLLNVEMVSTQNNKELVLNFINTCITNNITYKVDADYNDLDKTSLITSSNKDVGLGYKVVFEDHVEYCANLRELEQTYGDGKVLNTIDFYCTLDYDYIYIDKNIHIGYDTRSNSCKVHKPLNDFKLRDRSNLIKCSRKCSLCGMMSVFQDIKYFNKEVDL